MNPGTTGTLFHFVVALALSPRAKSIATEAFHLAERVGARITFIHSTSTDRTAAQKELTSLLENAARPGIEYTLQMDRRRPETAVSDAARKAGADLIVAGALEKESLLEGLIGSIARRIVRGAPCSVLLLPHESREIFRTVVISVQLDDESRNMIAFTLDLARRAGGQSIHLVHEPDSLDRIVTRATESIGPENRWESLTTETRSQLAALVDEYDFHRMEVHSETLESADGLASVEYVHRIAADLLAFPAPSRPLTFWDRFFQHPVERVLEHIACALLLYRPRMTSPRESLSGASPLSPPGSSRE